jgi:hypothetical protein
MSRRRRNNIQIIKHSRTKRNKKYLGVGGMDGGQVEGQVEPFHTHDGIFDVIGHTLSGYAGDVGEYVKEKTLRLAGLEPIDEDEKKAGDEDGKNGEVTGSPSMLSTLSANAVHQINEFLLDPNVQRGLHETLQKTSVILKDLLRNINLALSDPQLKEETKVALEHVADYVGIFVKAMDGPLNDAIDTLNRSGTKALSGALAGLIKVLTDMAAAVPGFGAVIELGKMANDASAAAGDVVEATTNTTSAISQAVSDTSENFRQGLEALHQKKREAAAIANRTQQSMRRFMGGG